MCEPISLGAVFASIGSAFKFADLAIRVSEVGSENEVFVRTIRVVRDDLHEVERLLNVDSVQRKLISIPGKLPWVKGAVVNTKSALNEIGRWVERARCEQESTGTIQFETRVRWVFNDHEKLLNRKTDLMTCHQQLSNVLSYLLRLEDVPAASEPPDYIDTTFLDDVLSRHRRATVPRKPLPSLNVTNALSGAQMASNSSKLSSPYQTFDGSSVAKVTIPCSPERLASWPDSPPCSPPPTYSSVVQDRHAGKGRSTDTMTVQSLEKVDHKPSLHCAVNEETQQQETKSFQTWAYRAPSGNDMSPLELAGDSIFMSGTNSLGPVNPFDFSADSIPKGMGKKESKSLGELLGDLTFAVELPTNDPGPPPGYPPRRTIMSSLPSANDPQATRSALGNVANQLRVQRERHEHRLSAPELPATARCRPFPQHTHSQPPTLLNTEASEKMLAQIPPESRHPIFELPSRYQNEPKPRGSYTPRTYHGHNPTLPRPSLHVAPEHPAQPYQSTNHTYQPSIQTPPPPATQTPQPRDPKPASTARIRRQKDMMDLLSSIAS